MTWGLFAKFFEIFSILILLVFDIFFVDTFAKYFCKIYRASNKSAFKCQDPNSTIIKTKLYFYGPGSWVRQGGGWRVQNEKKHILVFIAWFEPFISIFLYIQNVWLLLAPLPPVSNCHNLVDPRIFVSWVKISAEINLYYYQGASPESTCIVWHQTLIDSLRSKVSHYTNIVHDIGPLILVSWIL